MITPLLLFDKNEKLMRRIPATKLTDFVEVQELRTSFSLSGSVDVSKNREYVDDLDNAFYFGILDDKVLRLYSSQTVKLVDGDHIEFEGVFAPWVELAGYGYIEDKRPQDKPFDVYLGIIFTDSRWAIGEVPDDLPNSTQNFYYSSRLDALKTILDLFDVDVEFNYIFDGREITGHVVNFYAQMGVDTNRRYAFPSKALSVTRQSSMLDLYTSIVPRGDGIQNTDDEGNATNGYTRKITIEDQEWSVANGDPLDKPLGSKSLEFPDRTALFGMPDGSPREIVKDFDGCKDPADLIRLAYKELESISRPKIQFEATVEKLGQNVNLGDTITIVLAKFGIAYKTRVFKLEKNLLTNTSSVAQFGDYLVKSAAQRAYEMQAKLKQNSDDLDQSVADVNDVIDNGQTDVGDVQTDVANLQEAVKIIDGNTKQVATDLDTYITGATQEGTINFTGNNGTPTRDKIYNIVATPDGDTKRLIFNSKGLGYYDGDTLIRMAINADGTLAGASTAKANAPLAGEITTDSQGMATVKNYVKNNYQVWLQPIGESTAYVIQKNQNEFQIKTTEPNVLVQWKIQEV